MQVSQVGWDKFSGGILNVDKPRGMTSREVVDLVARPLKRLKVKVGHAGTLDPLATGVLVLCVGKATKLIECVQGQSKTYRAAIRLGATSDTLDADGVVTERDGVGDPGLERVAGALEGQVGEIDQRPPAYSALKIEGRRAYELAREGKAVEPEARKVQIDRVELLRYEWPWLEIEVQCGGGTYIRSIARDVGEKLGCGGLIEVLTRTAIGQFRLEEAVKADESLKDIENVRRMLLPMTWAMRGRPMVVLEEHEVEAIGMGKKVRGREAVAGEEIGLVDREGRLVATGKVVGDEIQPTRVLLG
jgi:tRNA pseudouridine55 synthase